MKIESEKIQFKNINENISQIFHDGKILQFWSPVLKAPYGIDEKFGKFLLQLELHENSTQHKHLKKIIENIENIIIKRLNLEDNEIKHIIRRQIGTNDLMETKMKQMKDRIITEVEFENKKDSYLKTIYDLDKNSYVKVYLEIGGIWDYREEGKREDHKVGLLLNVLKIKVLDINKIESAEEINKNYKE